MTNFAKPGRNTSLTTSRMLVGFLALFLFVSGCSKNSEPASDEKSEAKVSSLDKEDLKTLLSKRLSMGPPGGFAQLSQSIFMSSAKELPYCILLTTKSKEIANRLLLPAYPASYKPTLQEALDIISIQTQSIWSYTKKNDVVAEELKNVPIKKDVAIFEFTPGAKHKLSYEITIADDWTEDKKGMFVMYKPGNFPVGMDIYDLGPFTSDDASKEKELLKQIPLDVSLFWAKKVSPGKEISAGDLKPSKVADYDAFYYETMTPTKTGFEARWRQWAFMVDNRCYLVISTIFPNYDAKLYPQVQEMLKSFKVSR